ncbi:MAG: 3-keto-5-aminohexanoate cleavage protein [Promethearchaeia archaeon]|nr:MAG: 3-keto-5-aminohexanoate cleavage protein [Candidatus Lokiarchaeia archaeon]
MSNESIKWKEYIFDYTDTFEYLGMLRKGLPPAILCVCINGGIQGKESNPAIPETADEIADSVYEAYKAGASMVHIHARDPERQAHPATKTETWIEVNRKVREKCPDIIINNTTGGGLTSTMEDRLSCLDAGCEIASLNTVPDMGRYKMKARNPPLPDPYPEFVSDECVPYSYGIVEKFASEMLKRDIKPEVEIYHPGSHWVVQDLIAKCLLKKPYWLQTVMGYQTSSYATVENVIQLLKEFPEDSLWLCAGVGRNQLQMTTLAALMGGHLRVGLEDNIYYARSQMVSSNAQLVERAARIVKELNRKVATPAQAREMLGIRATPRNIP